MTPSAISELSLPLQELTLKNLSLSVIQDIVLEGKFLIIELFIGELFEIIKGGETLVVKPPRAFPFR